MLLIFGISMITGCSKEEKMVEHKENKEHKIEEVGAKLRGMMSWLFQKNKKEEVGV